MTPAEIVLRVGRRAQDGAVELSMLIPQLLMLRVTYGGERAATVQLTREQVGELRSALGEIERLMEQEQVQLETWNGSERRTSAA